MTDDDRRTLELLLSGRRTFAEISRAVHPSLPIVEASGWATEFGHRMLGYVEPWIEGYSVGNGACRYLSGLQLTPEGRKVIGS